MILVLASTALAQPPPIVNGFPAALGDYPETVALVRGTDSFCTGSLVHPEWVLTAAHCVVPDPGTFDIGFGLDAELLSDRIGVAEIVVHPTYVDLDAGGGTPQDDVALVRLADRKTDVLPMSLNPDPVDASWLGTEVTFSGFGITAWEGDGSGTKRFVDVPITGYDPTTLYTFDGVHSTCQGDSGGPGVLHKGSGYVQVAVTSYGVECGSGTSGAMRVDAYLPWIQSLGIEVRTAPASPPDFACSHALDAGEAVGTVPFELHCTADYSDLSEITGVEWLFGDGATDTGLSASHTYTEPGQYTVQACFEGTSAAGPWTHCAFRDGYVRACDVPRAAFSVVPSTRQGEPLTVELVNETPIDPYGCVQDLQWEVFAGDGTDSEPVDILGSGWSPQYTFAVHGEYTVVLHVGGYAGTGSAALTVDTRSGRGVGCSSAPGGGAAAVWIGLLALARRRKRS